MDFVHNGDVNLQPFSGPTGTEYGLLNPTYVRQWPSTYNGEKNNSTTSIHFLLGKIKLFSVSVFFQHKIFLYSLVFFLTKECVSFFFKSCL